MARAPTDAILGVAEFQTKAWYNYPVFMDSSREFFAALGNKSLLQQPLSSWNPFTLYADFNAVAARVKDKGLEGHVKGEGLLQGGLIIVSPTEGVTFVLNEKTGYELPYEKIEEALARVCPLFSSQPKVSPPVAVDPGPDTDATDEKQECAECRA